MTNTVEDTKLNPVDMDGLEDVFEVQEHTDSQSDNRQSAESQQGSEGMTLKEACKHFGLASSTIRTKLRTGELNGVKVPGRHGYEWRILPAACRQPANTADSQQSHTADSQQHSHITGTIIDLNSRLEAANEKLQAAAFRNGYLESQLEASRDTIKLLEDRSRVPWYRRAWVWFTGTSGT